MRYFMGKFVKKDGSTRTMTFAKLEDIPKKYTKNIFSKGASTRKWRLPANSELVWDMEKHDFRVFNHATSSTVLQYETDISTLLDAYFTKNN